MTKVSGLSFFFFFFPFSDDNTNFSCLKPLVGFDPKLGPDDNTLGPVEVKTLS